MHKKAKLLIILLLLSAASKAQDSSALINNMWTHIAGDSSLTYVQITTQCDSLFALAGYPPPPDTPAQGGQQAPEHSIDGSPFYDYSNWKVFFATRLDDGTGKPHNFGSAASVSAAMTNCGSTSALQSATPAIPSVFGWQLIGPHIASQNLGRINKIVVNPANSDEIYAEDYWGGLWKTENASAAPNDTWTCLSDQLPAIAGVGVGTFYVDFTTTPSPTIYCLMQVTTANPILNPRTILGIYYSQDNGGHFSPLPLTGTLPDLSSINDMQFWPGNAGAAQKYLFVTTLYQVIKIDITNLPTSATAAPIIDVTPPPMGTSTVIPNDDVADRFRGFGEMTFLPGDYTNMYVADISDDGNALSNTSELLKVSNCNTCTSCTLSSIPLNATDYLNGLGNFTGIPTVNPPPYYTYNWGSYPQWWCFLDPTTNIGWSQPPSTNYIQCFPSTTAYSVTSVETTVDGSYFSNITYTVSFTLTLPPQTEVDVVLKDINTNNKYAPDWGSSVTPTPSAVPAYSVNFAVGAGYSVSGTPTPGQYRNDGTTTCTVTVTNATVTVTHFVDRLEFGAYSLPGYVSTGVGITLANVTDVQYYENAITSLTANTLTPSYIYCYTDAFTLQGNEKIQDAAGTYSVSTYPYNAFSGGSMIPSPSNPNIIYTINNQVSLGYAITKTDISTSPPTITYCSSISQHADARCLTAIPNTTGTVTPTDDILFLGDDGGISKGEFNISGSNINGTGLNTSLPLSVGTSIHNGEVAIAASDNGILYASNNNFGNWTWFSTGDGVEVKYGKRYATRNMMFYGSSGGGYFGALDGVSRTSTPICNPIPELLVQNSTQPQPLSKMVTTWNGEYIGTGAPSGSNIYNVVIVSGAGTSASHYNLRFNSLTTDASFNPPSSFLRGKGQVQAVAPDMYDPSYIAAYMNSGGGDPQGYFAYCTNATVTATAPTWTLKSNYPVANPDISYSVHTTTQWAGLICMVADPRSLSSSKRLWAGANGYYPVAGTHRVFQTTDGGDTWSDISTGLPPDPVNALAYDEQSHYLFAGTDQGIYALNVDAATTGTAVPTWSCYSLNLPNSIVTGIDINRCTGKLYASLYGRGAYEADLPPDPNWNGTVTTGGAQGLTDICDIDNIPGTVTAPTFWTQDKDETRTIYIGPGHALVVQNCTLSMGRNKNIIVDIGGSLIVDGATITNSCGIMWGTISVLGNPSVGQDVGNLHNPISATSAPYCNNQGFVQLLPYVNGSTTVNPVIENSYLGVALCGIYYDGTDICDYAAGKEGGVLFADHATFHNCASGVFLEPYPNQTEISYLNNCHLYSDAPLQNTKFTDFTVGPTSPRPYGMEQGVYNNGTFGATFTNDVFETNNNAAIGFAPANDLRGTGYNGYNADATFHGCTFNNMTRGILSTTTLTGNVGVYNSTFTGCWRSISIHGGTNQTCFNNTITNGLRLGVVPTGETDPINAEGIYASTSGFHINQNTVNGRFDVFPDFGIYAQGLPGNTLYNNTINGCRYGMDAMLGPDGLCQIKCNTFNGPNITISLRLWSLAAYAIPPAEGSCSARTANAFNIASSVMQIKNFINYPGSPATPIVFYTYDNIPYQLNTSQLVKVRSNTFCAQSCSNFTSCCMSEPATYFKVTNDSAAAVADSSDNDNKATTITVDSAVQDLDSVDGSIARAQSTLSSGDAQSLYNVINNQSATSTRVKNALINAGPYLSDNVLLAVLNRPTPLNNSDLEAVIINNSALSDSVFNTLANVNPTVFTEQKVVADQSIPSARDRLQDSLTELYQEQYELVSALERFYDKKMQLNNAAKLMASHNQYETAFGYYLRDSNYTKAQNMINKVTDSALSTLMSITLRYNQNGISTDSLTSADSTTVAGISADRSTHAGEVAYIWYTHAYTLPFFEHFPDGMTDSSSAGARTATGAASPSSFDNNNSRGDIIIYPNPAQDVVTLKDLTGTWGKGSTVTATNLYGQKMFNAALPDNNMATVNTQSWASGLYLFTVQLGTGSQYIFKVVIRRE